MCRESLNSLQPRAVDNDFNFSQNRSTYYYNDKNTIQTQCTRHIYLSLYDTYTARACCTDCVKQYLISNTHEVAVQDDEFVGRKKSKKATKYTYEYTIIEAAECNVSRTRTRNFCCRKSCIYTRNTHIGRTYVGNYFVLLCRCVQVRALIVLTATCFVYALRFLYVFFSLIIFEI